MKFVNVSVKVRYSDSNCIKKYNISNKTFLKEKIKQIKVTTILFQLINSDFSYSYKPGRINS